VRLLFGPSFPACCWPIIRVSEAVPLAVPPLGEAQAPEQSGRFENLPCLAIYTGKWLAGPKESDAATEREG